MQTRLKSVCMSKYVDSTSRFPCIQVRGVDYFLEAPLCKLNLRPEISLEPKHAP